MAIDVDAIGVFYQDRTYDLVLWENILDLDIDQPVVTIGIFHVQTPGRLPNVPLLTGHTFYSLRHTVAGMQARQADRAPPIHTKKFFKKNSVIQTSASINLIPDACGGGMEALFESMDFADPNYTILQGDVVIKALELRSASVPDSGTY